MQTQDEKVTSNANTTNNKYSTIIVLYIHNPKVKDIIGFLRLKLKLGILGSDSFVCIDTTGWVNMW